MAERCERTDLLVTDCAHCRRLPDPPKPASERGPWFTARYVGTCSCGTTFIPGDQIRADGEGGYLCDVCGQEDNDD